MRIDPVPHDSGSGAPEPPDTGVEPDGGTPVDDREPIVLEPLSGRFAVAQVTGCGCASAGTGAMTVALPGLIALMPPLRRP